MTTKFSQPRYSLTNVSGMLQVDGSYILVRVDECTFLCSGRAIKARLEGYRIPKRPQTGEQPAFQMIRDCFSKRPTKGAFQDVYLDIIIQHAGGREGDYRIEQVLDVSQRTTGSLTITAQRLFIPVPPSRPADRATTVNPSES